MSDHPVTPERKQRLFAWGRNALMVIAFGGMAFAIDKLIRTYSYEQIADALSAMPLWAIVGAIAVVALQHAVSVVREWIAVGYADKREVGVAHTALASVVARSLSTLGVPSITGVGLRLRLYGGWGLENADVARITTYNELVFLVGVVAQFAVVFTALPVPPTLADWIGETAVRGIGIGAVVLCVGFVALCARGPTALRVRSFAIPVPNSAQLAGVFVFPIVDLFLDALIVKLCLPAVVPLAYTDLVVVCLLASIAGSLSQIPGGLGVLEGTVLLFAPGEGLAPAIIGALLGRRIITNLLPIVVGAGLLVALEMRRRTSTPRPEWLVEATAGALSTLMFVVSVIVMLLAASSRGARYGDVGQIVALAAGTAGLFVARGLQQRSRRAWRVTVALVAVRSLAGFLAPPPLLVIVILVVLAVMLALSHDLFDDQHRVSERSFAWGIAITLVLAGTAWVGFGFEGHHATTKFLVGAGVMLAVAAFSAGLLVVLVRRARLRATLGQAPLDVLRVSRDTSST
ncbi:MAG: hypothetical protein SFX73_13070 [Kofleriaceae bacterium]|nr:hypothetical protein [Kofleriaceae bacterium]